MYSRLQKNVPIVMRIADRGNASNEITSDPNTRASIKDFEMS